MVLPPKDAPHPPPANPHGLTPPERLKIDPRGLLKADPDVRNRLEIPYLVWERKLAELLQKDGQRQDILVFRVGDALQVAAGETRRRAAIIAGIDVWVRVLPGALTRSQVMLETWNENAMRRDPTPLEQCEFLLKMQRETGWTQTELAKHTGVVQGTICRLLELKDLTPKNRERMTEGLLNFGQCYQLARVKDQPAQDELGDRTVRLALDRDTLSGEVNRLLGGKKPKAKPVKIPLPGGGVLTLPSSMNWPQYGSLIALLGEKGKVAERSNLSIVHMPSLLKPNGN